MKVTTRILFLCMFMQIGISAQSNLIPKKSLEQINEEHTFLKKFSWPNPDTSIVDSLIHSDFRYFDSLVNMVYLVKYDSLFDPRFNELIHLLQVDTSDSILLQGAIELSSYGHEALMALDKVTDTSTNFHYWRHIVRALVLGYETKDFITEVKPDYFRMELTGSSPRRSYYNLYGGFENERSNLESSLNEFISSSSYNLYKHRYHQLVLDAYKKGVLTSSYVYGIIQRIITQEVRNKEEAYLNDYLSLINEISEHDALILLEFVTFSRTASYYPQLFVDLLENENTEIVNYIIERSSSCGDEYMCPKVKNKLIKIFHGNDDALKFKTAFALMHDCEYPPAYAYLMHEVDLNRDGRRYTAIAWLGDPSNWGNPMSDTMNTVLGKYLSSTDDRIKRATIKTYLTYNSPNVIEALVPFVDYELESVADDIVKKLLKYEDKAFTRAKLEGYIATGHGSEKHVQLLEKLQ